MLDTLDKNILTELQRDARISNTELARRINLSPPATLTRVKRLEKDGFIQNYAAIINRQKAGYDLLCFISVSLQLHDTDQVTGFIKIIQEMSEVLECHHVTGEYDYLLKVVTRNTEDLEHFLMHRLTPVSGVARIHTNLVLREAKSTSEIPLK
ncbi:MAG: Lrp/AsnC family transcriptional regulator [Anaerolineae bacterium]|jgi:Lrp/AsnC family leucine-responsive transcriptional regulator|nr:Lrp/AsnC family transcriptional regulator [Anaerolineae bacterium]MBT4311358.1 Lrp/AsnC family transcriptional regulator [Anaerolineae bacterium]MBT4459584.1 Lrp/AsnC family transcriptional regulator [Anaerolineae bacterium]MBT4841659.1 Lrp/AsnC family transcriptional regulator [Anaerolineae bacterium]MBT6060158.1 Lrp/AsnC family transcriptional regulator [Anaerolineae bacterium]